MYNSDCIVILNDWSRLYAVDMYNKSNIKL